MAVQRKKPDGLSLPVRLLLAAAVLMGCLLLLPIGKTPTEAPAAENTSAPATPAQLLEEPLPVPETPAEEPPSAVEESADQELAEEEAPAQPEEEYTPIVYDTRSYQLVTDMVYAYKKQVSNRGDVIARDVAALKEHDPRLGEAWGTIMDYWEYANREMPLHYDRLPDDLPDDDSLCIVVLGFQLLPEGEMSPEMHGRCELALKAAQQYPRAYVAVTGGGTAFRNPDATEAGVMAEWFLRKGVDRERLILEDRSSTTEENARFTLQILTEQVPQVKSLVIVSSDYHLPLGCLMFTEAAALYGCEHGETPFAVVSNLALQGYGQYEYKNPEEQGLYVWSLADPRPSSP